MEIRIRNLGAGIQANLERSGFRSAKKSLRIRIRIRKLGSEILIRIRGFFKGSGSGIWDPRSVVFLKDPEAGIRDPPVK